MTDEDLEAITGTVSLHLGDEKWHDGPGWYYTLDEYPDEGSCGAFPTKNEAIAHARGCGYSVDHVQPDA